MMMVSMKQQEKRAGKTEQAPRDAKQEAVELDLSLASWAVHLAQSAKGRVPKAAKHQKEHYSLSCTGLDPIFS